MKLCQINITNLYGVSDETPISIREFNVLVGRNDVGKSTILKGLDLFLNNKTPPPDASNLGTDNTIVTIELIFDIDDTEIIIDEAIPTTFSNEEILSENGQLKVKKNGMYQKLNQSRQSTFTENHIQTMISCFLLRQN